MDSQPASTLDRGSPAHRSGAARGLLTGLVAGLLSVSLALVGLLLPGAAMAAPGDLAGMNLPPVAGPDAATTTPGVPIAVAVLANDSDPEGGPLTLQGAAPITPGAAAVAVSGPQVVISPASGFVGRIEVAYSVLDSGGAAALGLVAVSVVQVPPNAPPVARSDLFKARAGRQYRIRVLANDVDPEGTSLRLVQVSGAVHGEVRRSGARVWYRSARGFQGVDVIRYAVADQGGAITWGTLTIQVTAAAARPAPKPPKPTQPPVVKPPRPAPPPAVKPPDSGPAPQSVAVERALAGLGLPVGKADGRYDAGTRRAMCAWRTIMGRPVSRGLPSGGESAALIAGHALPRALDSMVTGVNISRTCQVGFWVSAQDSYRRIMAATTGKPGFRTRTGVFRIFRTHHTWRWSTIYPEARMYKPMQFSGGQAMHGSARDSLVKTYPASHGCVRMLHRDINALQAGGVGNGTRVRVFGNW